MTRYDSVFLEVFPIAHKDLNESFAYQSIDAWDSVGHMELISKLESTFGIQLEMDDVIDFSSYVEGKKIFLKYGIDVEK